MGLFTPKRGDPTRQWVDRRQPAGSIEPDEESTRGPGTHAVHSVRQARQAEAWALLDEARDLSLAARSTRSVALCLAALARWALVAGDPERAALVAGAAEGLRRRAGLRVWPMLRQGEADLVAQVRQALGADHFDQVFATAPSSPSGTRWQLPGPARRQYLADGITGNTPVVRRLAPMSAPAGPAVSADRKRRLAA
jgi:hypothetical protein